MYNLHVFGKLLEEEEMSLNNSKSGINMLEGESRVAFHMNISLRSREGRGLQLQGCSANHEITHTAEGIWLM